MFRRKKKQLSQSSTSRASEPIGSFVSAHSDTESDPKKKRNAKKKRKSNKSKGGKGKKSEPKILPKKTKSKKKKNTKKSKTQTNIKLNDTKNKKKKKKDKKNQRDRAQTVQHKSTTNKSTKKDKKKRSKSKGPKSRKPKENTIELNTISHSPPKQESKSKQFPWANWAIDHNETTDDEKDDGPGHRARRSSLGSVREFHIERAKRARIKTVVAPSNHDKKKDKKKKKKKNKQSMDNKLDIYDPNALKKKRKKEKKQQKFKIVPKHHVKRSSLPTYQSIRKNNPQLTFFVKKETQRNLATLLDQPEKRAKSKKLKNLSRCGFDLHVNHRYRLEDGRIGVCKFKGRTAFGKSSEDWIGLVIQVGEGEHDGTVQGKTYFRCRDGKGLFVRPYDIIQDMGSQNKILTKQDIKLAKKHIERYKKMNDGTGTVTSTDVMKEKGGDLGNPDHGYDMMHEKFYNSKTLLDKNKGKKAKKKKHHTQV